MPTNSREYTKKYYHSHKEYYKEYHRKYYLKHKDKITKKVAEYRKQNPEAALAVACMEYNDTKARKV